MSVAKQRGLAVLKYLAFFSLFYVLGQAGIKNLIYPFAFGLFYALIWCNQKIYILAPLYILASVLSNLSLDSLVIASSTSLVILLAYFLHYKFKKPMKPWVVCLYALISQAGYVWISITSGNSIIVALTTVVLGLLFLMACLVFFSAVFVRGITARFKVFELICGAVFLMAVACGFNNLTVFNFEVVKFFACLVILFSAYCLNVSYALVISGVLGIGTMLNAGNPVYVAPFIAFSLTVSALKFSKRWLPCLAVLAVEVALGFYFDLYYSYSYISLLPVALACLFFVCVPKSLIENVNDVFSSSAQNLAMRNIVNRNRESLARRFSNLSEVFCEMDRVFRSMIKGGLSIEQAKELLAREVKEKLFDLIPEKDNAFKIYEKETHTVLLELIGIALERNKITLLDIPPYFTNKFGRINTLVSLVNDAVDQYKQYAGFMNNLDASRVLIAEQLTGISKVMRSLSEELSKTVVFDNSRENKIIDELTYNNIICNEAIIYEQNSKILNISLVVKSEDANKSRLPKVVSKVIGFPMVVNSINPAIRGGWCVVELKSSPKFDVVFGTAGCAKSGNLVSGDCYSLIRLENYRFMMALCDGMGNGEEAERASSLAVGLLENFYKAGFDNEIILSSVNNLLSLGSSEEMFSALDICVLDLKNGIADFIKLGASIGFVKHPSRINKIKSESLPIGIVREMKPSVQKVVLLVGDLIIMCSDGVTDSFENETEMEDYIKSISTVNPQTIADEILEKAKINCQNAPKDDMTVLVARIFER